MGDHFSAIGLDFRDDASLARFTGRVVRGATEVGCTAAGSHLQWIDPSGACVLFHLDKRRVLECMTPFFSPPEGLARWRVHTSSAAIDGQCQHCSGADCDILDASDEIVTRAAVQFAMFAPYKAWLRTDRTYDLEVVAFAQQASFFATRAEFEATQAEWWGDARTPSGEPLRFDEVSFFPQGLLGTGQEAMGDRAKALMGGRVESATLRCSAQGKTFQHVRVASLPGLTDVVVNPASMTGTPTSGCLAWVEAWLVGRPVDPPPPPGGSFWSRLMART